MSEELRPCPFCGSKARESETIDIDGNITYWINCSSSGSDICSVMPYTRYWDCEEKEKAIKAWNTRTTELEAISEKNVYDLLFGHYWDTFEQEKSLLKGHLKFLAKLIGKRFGQPKKLGREEIAKIIKKSYVYKDNSHVSSYEVDMLADAIVEAMEKI